MSKSEMPGQTSIKLLILLLLLIQNLLFFSLVPSPPSIMTIFYTTQFRVSVSTKTNLNFCVFSFKTKQK